MYECICASTRRSSDSRFFECPLCYIWSVHYVIYDSNAIGWWIHKYIHIHTYILTHMHIHAERLTCMEARSAVWCSIFRASTMSTRVPCMLFMKSSTNFTVRSANIPQRGCITYMQMDVFRYVYGVVTISRLLQIVILFCRI